MHGANLGRGAGRLDAAGGTTTVTSPSTATSTSRASCASSRTASSTPVPGVDVVYYVGGMPLGVSVTDAQGQYRLLGVPAGPYRLEAGLNQRDKTASRATAWPARSSSRTS